MLSKINFHQPLKSYVKRYCSINLNLNNKPFRVATENENENHDAMRNSERFKYKTQANENLLSQTQTVGQNTSIVEKIQVLSPTESKNQKSEVMCETRDRLGQWPMESESELTGYGLQRLRNGRFNKVSSDFKPKFIDYKKKLFKSAT